MSRRRHVQTTPISRISAGFDDPSRPGFSTTLALLLNVTSSRGTLGFTRLRRHSIAKFCAVSFIVLIVLPFTAPFPAFSLATSAQSDPYDTPSKDLKDIVAGDAQLGVLSDSSLLALPSVVTVLRPNVCSLGPIDEPPHRQLVLRI